MVRQTTPGNKFLILAGRVKTAKALENTDVEIDKESIEQANHFRHEETPEDEDRIQHVFCCVLNKHEEHQRIHEEEQQDQAEGVTEKKEKSVHQGANIQDTEGEIYYDLTRIYLKIVFFILPATDVNTVCSSVFLFPPAFRPSSISFILLPFPFTYSRFLIPPVFASHFHV